MVFTRVKISPRKVELAILGVPLCRIRINTPVSPSESPKPFRKVIFSLSISAAKTKANIGLVERRIEELMGEVISKHTRKRVWLMTTPKKEQAKRKIRSLRLTRSFGRKKDAIQNKTAVETFRNATRANGLIEPGMTDFATE